MSNAIITRLIPIRRATLFSLNVAVIMAMGSIFRKVVKPFGINMEKKRLISGNCNSKAGKTCPHNDLTVRKEKKMVARLEIFNGLIIFQAIEGTERFGGEYLPDEERDVAKFRQEIKRWLEAIPAGAGETIFPLSVFFSVYPYLWSEDILGAYDRAIARLALSRR
jgi:hypothetical protein